MKRGLTVKELISRIGGKISPAYINKIERYEEIPKPELIIKLAEILDLDHVSLLLVAQLEKVSQYRIKIEKRYEAALKCRDTKYPKERNLPIYKHL
jgi:transcriptional regulator with XRE-family HTH domain